MNILIAPDSFKESLTALQAAKHIEAGIKKVNKAFNTQVLPLADGGEGTVEALVKNTGGRIIRVKVHDPLMRKIDSFYGIMGDHMTAVVEMSAASGLALLKEEEKNPWLTTTYGTGELIRHAMDEGCRKIIIGLGGSATNDGGAGMAMALGVRLLNAQNKAIGYGGGALNDLYHIDIAGMDQRIKDCSIMVACDVSNPLTGKNGASFVYGPQKGADKKMVTDLDENLKHYASLIKKMIKKDVDQVESAGAAGGIAAGLMAFLDAELKPGFQIIKDFLSLEKKMENIDLIITGEGKMDYQTQYGKTPFGLAQLAARYKKPVIGITGMIGEGADTLLNKGFTALFPIADKPMSLEESKKNAGLLMENTAERIFRLLYHISFSEFS